MRTTSQWFLVLATVYMSLSDFIEPVSAHYGGKTIYVRPHHKIQAAIDSAHSGDTIVVEAGQYAEQLTISKDGISLIGHDAVLVPPKHSVHNYCSGLAGPGTDAGICIQGSGIKLEDFVTEHRKFISAARRVNGVTVTGFCVRGFSGLNIAVLGAQNTKVTRNNLGDGQQYGALTVGSKNSLIASNTVTSSPPTIRFIGICMDDLASVKVSDNHISGYNIGLCVQTAGAEVCGNDVSNCCVGAFVDPGIIGAKVEGNHIGKANSACPTFAGAFGVWGVVISGASNTEVKGNDIEGQTDHGRADWYAAGIAVFDNPDPAVLAVGNKIVGNVLRNNDLDLLIYTNGTGNVVKDNKCTTPSELCG